ncbi:hypothetical protein ACFQ1E_20260 [Sphingomonas canadensis]|uniref:Apolipoprotein acyltransferase n=1 Tax=Sphingomonas canadensis TaxID=1219257 RepID=A0ABW3HDH3_9SPHN|nr:hypothetical protein [Sphingomonas canadensis]MCW3838408.1 hypothetical protein [Sphingomonas canadensis]
MPTAAIEDLNDILARITAADAAIDEARGRIVSEAEAMAGHFASGPWDEEAPEPDVQPAIDTVADASDHAAEALGTRLSGVVDTARDAVHGIEQAIAQASEQWNSTLHTAEGATREFSAALAEQTQQVQEALRQLDTHLQSAEATWSSAHEAVDGLVERFATEIESNFERTLREACDAFLDDLHGPQTEAVERHLSDAREQAESALERMSQVAEQLLADFEQQVDAAVRDLGQHVSSEVQEKLEAAMQRIIEAAVKRILETILEAVASTQLGAAVTGAMSPVLPELIAIKKLTDVILQAIRIWKDTIGRFGDLF